jgi:hypothetical protein
MSFAIRLKQFQCLNKSPYELICQAPTTLRESYVANVEVFFHFRILHASLPCRTFKVKASAPRRHVQWIASSTKQEVYEGSSTIRARKRLQAFAFGPSNAKGNDLRSSHKCIVPESKIEHLGLFSCSLLGAFLSFVRWRAYTHAKPVFTPKATPALSNSQAAPTTVTNTFNDLKRKSPSQCGNVFPLFTSSCITPLPNF